MSVELREYGDVEKDGDDKKVREVEGQVEAVGKGGGPLPCCCGHGDR